MKTSSSSAACHPVVVMGDWNADLYDSKAVSNTHKAKLDYLRAFLSDNGFEIVVPVPLDFPGGCYGPERGNFTRIPNILADNFNPDRCKPSLLDFCAHSEDIQLLLQSS